MGKDPICQSCGMPLHTPEVMGTEKDGSRTKLYCKYCYENGAFTHPDMTLVQMKVNVKRKMKEMNIPAKVIEGLVRRLSSLKRWKKSLKTA